MKFSILFLIFSLLENLSSASILQEPPIINRNEVRRGIDLLYNGVATCEAGKKCEDDLDKENLVDEAISMKNKYFKILQNYKLNDLKWIRDSRNQNIEKFEFSSPIQKPGANSNKVYGVIYRPMLPFGCENMKLPGTLLVHHVADDISDEKSIAKIASTDKRSVIMIIYLPNYGPRRESKTNPYFSSDINEFKDSLFQSLLDLRVAADILSDDPMVDTNQLQIGGLSLGAVITAIIAGIDPIFSKYLIGLGGGDLAGIMTSDKSKLSGVIFESLKNINWDTTTSRKELAAFDALTWSYTVKNKTFIIINAKDDEIIDYELSYKKLLNAYNENGSNKVKTYSHEGRHVPDKKTLGLFKGLTTYMGIIFKVFDFIGEIPNTKLMQCDRNQI